MARHADRRGEDAPAASIARPASRLKGGPRLLVFGSPGH